MEIPNQYVVLSDLIPHTDDISFQVGGFPFHNEHQLYIH